MKDTKKMPKNEKIEKAKQLIQDLKALELSDEEFNEVSGGVMNAKKNHQTKNFPIVL